jgi:hypothetical protein
MDVLVTDPILGYRVNDHRMLQIQTGLLGSGDDGRTFGVSGLHHAVSS